MLGSSMFESQGGGDDFLDDDEYRSPSSPSPSPGIGSPWPGAAEMEGELQRYKGRFRKRWVTEWFGLQQNFLVSFASQKNPKVVVCVALSSVTVCETYETHNQPCRFHILHSVDGGGKVTELVLKAASYSEMKNWIAAVNKQVKKIQDSLREMGRTNPHLSYAVVPFVHLTDAERAFQRVQEKLSSSQTEQQHDIRHKCYPFAAAALSAPFRMQKKEVFTVLQTHARMGARVVGREDGPGSQIVAGPPGAPLMNRKARMTQIRGGFLFLRWIFRARKTDVLRRLKVNASLRSLEIAHERSKAVAEEDFDRAKGALASLLASTHCEHAKSETVSKGAVMRAVLGSVLGRRRGSAFAQWRERMAVEGPGSVDGRRRLKLERAICVRQRQTLVQAASVLQWWRSETRRRAFCSRALSRVLSRLESGKKKGALMSWREASAAAGRFGVGGWEDDNDMELACALLERTMTVAVRQALGSSMRRLSVHAAEEVSREAVSVAENAEGVTSRLLTSTGVVPVHRGSLVLSSVLTGALSNRRAQAFRALSVHALKVQKARRRTSAVHLMGSFLRRTHKSRLLSAFRDWRQTTLVEWGQKARDGGRIGVALFAIRSITRNAARRQKASVLARLRQHTALVLRETATKRRETAMRRALDALVAFRALGSASRAARQRTASSAFRALSLHAFETQSRERMERIQTEQQKALPPLQSHAQVQVSPSFVERGAQAVPATREAPVRAVVATSSVGVGRDAEEETDGGTPLASSTLGSALLLGGAAGGALWVRGGSEGGVGRGGEFGGVEREFERKESSSLVYREAELSSSAGGYSRGLSGEKEREASWGGRRETRIRQEAAHSAAPVAPVSPPSEAGVLPSPHEDREVLGEMGGEKEEGRRTSVRSEQENERSEGKRDSALLLGASAASASAVAMGSAALMRPSGSRASGSRSHSGGVGGMESGAKEVHGGGGQERGGEVPSQPAHAPPPEVQTANPSASSSAVAVASAPNVASHRQSSGGAGRSETGGGKETAAAEGGKGGGDEVTTDPTSATSGTGSGGSPTRRGFWGFFFGQGRKEGETPVAEGTDGSPPQADHHPPSGVGGDSEVHPVPDSSGKRESTSAALRERRASTATVRRPSIAPREDEENRLQESAGEGLGMGMEGRRESQTGKVKGSGGGSDNLGAALDLLTAGAYARPVIDEDEQNADKQTHPPHHQDPSTSSAARPVSEAHPETAEASTAPLVVGFATAVFEHDPVKPGSRRGSVLQKGGEGDGLFSDEATGTHTGAVRGGVTGSTRPPDTRTHSRPPFPAGSDPAFHLVSGSEGSRNTSDETETWTPAPSAHAAPRLLAGGMAGRSSQEFAPEESHGERGGMGGAHDGGAVLRLSTLPVVSRPSTNGPMSHQAGGGVEDVPRGDASISPRSQSQTVLSEFLTEVEADDSLSFSRSHVGGGGRTSEPADPLRLSLGTIIGTPDSGGASANVSSRRHPNSGRRQGNQRAEGRAGESGGVVLRSKTSNSSELNCLTDDSGEADTMTEGVHPRANGTDVRGDVASRLMFLGADVHEQRRPSILAQSGASRSSCAELEEMLSGVLLESRQSSVTSLQPHQQNPSPSFLTPQQQQEETAGLGGPRRPSKSLSAGSVRTRGSEEDVPGSSRGLRFPRGGLKSSQSLSHPPDTCGGSTGSGAADLPPLSFFLRRDSSQSRDGGRGTGKGVGAGVSVQSSSLSSSSRPSQAASRRATLTETHPRGALNEMAGGVSGRTERSLSGAHTTPAASSGPLRIGPSSGCSLSPKTSAAVLASIQNSSRDQMRRQQAASTTSSSGRQEGDGMRVPLSSLSSFPSLLDSLRAEARTEAGALAVHPSKVTAPRVQNRTSGGGARSHRVAEELYNGRKAEGNGGHQTTFHPSRRFL